MTEGKYLASEMKVEADRERLSLLEQTWDSVTIRNLEMLGVSAGWKCLDVGAGYGSITTWLGERVAPDGKVVATDIRAELHRDSSEIIEIRQHDILKDELEQDYYDLVHCRSVLQHLSEPEIALSRMASALKPGGWILVEEFDNFTIPVSDSNNKDADLYYKFRKAGGDIAEKRGIRIDQGFGRKTPSMIKQLGFQQVENQGTLFINQGGDPWSRSSAMTFEAGLKMIEGRGNFSEEERKVIADKDRVNTLLHDPSFYYVGAPLICAWGRKPISKGA